MAFVDLIVTIIIQLIIVNVTKKLINQIFTDIKRFYYYFKVSIQLFIVKTLFELTNALKVNKTKRILISHLMHLYFRTFS